VCVVRQHRQILAFPRRKHTCLSCDQNRARTRNPILMISIAMPCSPACDNVTPRREASLTQSDWPCMQTVHASTHPMHTCMYRGVLGETMGFDTLGHYGRGHSAGLRKREPAAHLASAGHLLACLRLTPGTRRMCMGRQRQQQVSAVQCAAWAL